MFPFEMAPARLVPFALVVALLTAPARAEDADALIKQGIELRRAGKDQAALEQFRRAYDLAPTPRALAQMGLAEQALSRWLDGETHLTKALEAAQDSWIAKYRETLEGSRAEIAKHLGALSVTGGPDGAELRVDGQPVGTLPLRRTLRLPIGTHALDVSVAGHTIETRTASVEVGVTTHEDLAASPQPATPTLVTPEPAPSAPPGGPDAPAITRRGAAWIATGGAVALATAGAIFWLAGRNDADTYNASTSCRNGTGGAPCTDLRTSGNRDYALALGAGVAAGALGATAAVLFLKAPSGAPREPRVACLPDLFRAGASCALRF
jgi:tetratricopeptide (TPR) repeat protein